MPNEAPFYLLADLDGATLARPFDYLVRVSGTSVENADFYITGTEKFKRHFGNIFKLVKDTLVEVILSQKRSLNYNGVYNAFLLGQLSEEDFERLAAKFAYKPKYINPQKLSLKINILFNYTSIDYSTSELADIFRCNIDDVEESINLITGNKLEENH